MAAATSIELSTPRLAAVLENGSGVSIGLLDNGSVAAIRHGELLVNQVPGSPLGGGIGNVYLRRRTRSGAAYVPLLGPSSASVFAADGAGAAWTGTFDDLEYTCRLRLANADATWFWTVETRNMGRQRVTLDVVLAQDVGLADEAAVRASERYTSQYLDHTIIEDPAHGFLIGTRQNLPQAGAAPWLMHGCLDGAVGYLTDGLQLYGLEHRATGVAEALCRARLPNRKLQGELALPTLQSRAVTLDPGGVTTIMFFAALLADHPAATGPADRWVARAAALAHARLLPLDNEPPVVGRLASAFDAPARFPSRDLDASSLQRWFGWSWRHVERRDGQLLSFFHGREHHVVLRAKELVVERPTGLIMQSGREIMPSDETLSVTTWMGGVFAAQLAIGNTSFNALLGVARNPADVLRASGQRIFIRTDRGLELLGLPSAFEMGPTSARWIYEDDRYAIVVRVATSLEAPVCRLTIDVARGGPLAFLVTHGIVLGADGAGPPGTATIDQANGRVELRPHPSSPVGERYPGTTYHLVAADPASIDAIGGAELLDADAAGPAGTHVVVRTLAVDHLDLALSGSILDRQRAHELALASTVAANHATAAAEPAEPASADPVVPDADAGSLLPGLGRGAALGGGSGRRADDIARLNDVVPWYLHDALIHLATPHGLEQSSGAAWGLRDVCQGPVELLLATAHPAPIREILRTVYAHQQRSTGDWPQWFMVDRYREIVGPDSHADIIHWPLKALCDYIELTGDLAILDEEVGYADETTSTPDGTSTPIASSDPTEPILAHVVRQLDRIEQDVIPGTSLPVFGGGDWEDTLQPADPAMAQRLVSSWTVELAYQTLGRLRAVAARAGLAALEARLGGMTDRLRADFNEHLVPDGVVAGLAHFGPDGIEYLLHPRDRRTGITYRLLPMTRGIISGLFTPTQATAHAAVIQEHLRFPDGVRLMDRPMAYHGGPSQIFRRAESAANFGREIGLQYVHAHLRYVEAMTVMGLGRAAFDGLLAVCPIRLELDVPNALPRQSNAYFSSSDAAFADRRQASRQFERLRTGEVGVKGGWRVYSSGPGIFLNQLVRNMLGLRTQFDDVLFDPVLPDDADGLTFDLEYEGRRVRYRFRVERAGFSPREVRVNGRLLPGGRYSHNPYRRGGLLVTKVVFLAALRRNRNVVEIFV